MLIADAFFYLFATVCVAAGFMVISARNPVHAVLFLILAFFSAAGLFVLLGAEFLASSLNQYERTVQDVVSFMKSEGRIPDAIWLGSQVVSPESFLITTARYVMDKPLDPERASEIFFEPAELRPAKHVKNDKSIWDWVVFPPNFEAPEMMELARRQSWTLKPALPIWKTVKK